MRVPVPLRQIHLDFHNCDLVPIADDFDPEEFADTLAAAAVDSVTVFSRCAHGYIYHDTKFAEARHPRLQRDLLGEQIAALHARGIQAPVYISVGLDERLAHDRPDYIALDEAGRHQGINGRWVGPLQPGWRHLCLNSPYVDYVIDQTAEVLQRFDVDGFFFDIVTQYGCCCQRCVDGMRAAGLDPDSPVDRAQWDDRVVGDYRRRQTAAIRAVKPDCRIFYNSGHVSPAIRPALDDFTHLEIESLPTGEWGYDHFPLVARYTRTLGKDYLGMTGRFLTMWGDFGSYKAAAALDYDVNYALAQGAAVSIGDQLHPRGALDPATYELIGGAYRPAAAKEPWCRDARAVADVAMVTPEIVGGDARERKRVSEPARGALRLLEEGHWQFDVVDLAGPLDRYRLLVLPDVITLTDDQASVLEAFAARGGRIIASHRSGLSTDGAFRLPGLGIEHHGDLPNARDYLQVGDAFEADLAPARYVMHLRGSKVTATAEVAAEIWRPYFERSAEHWMSHLQAAAAEPTGDPGIVIGPDGVYFAHPIFEIYGRYGSPAVRELFAAAMRRLLPDPVLAVDAPTWVKTSLTEQPGRRIVHILAYVREQFSDLEMVTDTAWAPEVELRLTAAAPASRVYLAPDRSPVEHEWSDGVARVRLTDVRGHAMVVFEQ